MCGQTRRAKTLHSAHTFLPNHTLPTHPHYHLSHPPPHNPTLHTELKKLVFNCVPQIFLSEYIDMAYAEMVIRSVNPQPWRFANKSLGLLHAHSLSDCLFLWVCVVCVFFLLYLSFYLSCARCVFCVLFRVHNHLFVPCDGFPFSFSTNLIGIYVTVLIDVRIILLICLSSLSICVFRFVISAYVCLIRYTHFHTLPYSFDSIKVSICEMATLHFVKSTLWTFHDLTNWKFQFVELRLFHWSNWQSDILDLHGCDSMKRSRCESSKFSFSVVNLLANYHDSQVSVVLCYYHQFCMGWLWLVGSLKIKVSFVKYGLFDRALLQKRPVVLGSLLSVATA